MGTRIKLLNLISGLMFLLVFAASLVVFYFTRSGDGHTDFIINIVFEGLTLVFLLAYFIGCIRPLTRAVSALCRVKDDILCAEEEPRVLWARYSKNYSPFNHRRLDERYSAYLRHLRRLYKQNAITADCDIDEYIDEEQIYTAVNKPFCDQLGGIMSGLGILFTFIGLVYGLRSFDASTVETMQQSTQALMAGIKIAFLTSIFGLIYSLLLNLFYKRTVKGALEALYEFQDVYTEYVRPSNAFGAQNAMLRLQTEQNAALERFGSSVGDQVSESIITLMKPTVDTMHQAITQYTTVAIEDQRAGMERVVRYFLDSMNTSMGAIFTQMGTRIEELSIWERDMIDSIRSMTDCMGATTESLSQAQVSAETITRRMADYTEKLEALTAAQSGVVEQMAAFTAETDAARTREAEYIRQLSEAGRSVAENARASLDISQAVAAVAADLRADEERHAAAVSDASAHITAAADAVNTMTETVIADIGAAAQRLEQAAEEMEGGLSRTVAETLAVVNESLTRLTAAMDGVTAASASVQQAYKSVPKSAAATDAYFKATAKAIDTELKLLLSAVSDTQKLFNKFNADLEHRVDG